MSSFSSIVIQSQYLGWYSVCLGYLLPDLLLSLLNLLASPILRWRIAQVGDASLEHVD